MFERLNRTLQRHTIEDLWAAAREAWNETCVFFRHDFVEFAAIPVSRHDHAIIRPHVLGLEHFVRRALLLAAMALKALPAIFGPGRATAASPRPPVKPRRYSLRIFEPARRGRSSASRRRFRLPPAGPHPDGPLAGRYSRDCARELKQRHLALDSLERPRALPAASPPRPACASKGQKLPLRPDKVCGRGLAVRMSALYRILENPDAHVRRLRRAIDRHAARREASPAIAPLGVTPWPRDEFARRIVMHASLGELWPGAGVAIAAMLAGAPRRTPSPDSS